MDTYIEDIRNDINKIETGVGATVEKLQGLRRKIEASNLPERKKQEKYEELRAVIYTLNEAAPQLQRAKARLNNL